VSNLIQLDNLNVFCEQGKKGDTSYLLLKLDGKLVSDNVTDLTRELENLFASEIIHTLMDISLLSYVNSTGLSLLLTLWKKVINNNKKLVFFNLHPFMDELFKMTELNSKFLIKDDLESALDSI
jgi:anti-anti-sigma factor